MQRVYFDKMHWKEFEFLTLSYLQKINKGVPVKWLGELGKDEGADLWIEYESGKTYCYQCKNWRKLTFAGVKKSIDALVSSGKFPDHFIVVCGGAVNNKLRNEIEEYTKSVLTKKVEVWNGGEFEAKLRSEAPELLGIETWKHKKKLDSVKSTMNFEDALNNKPNQIKPTPKLLIHFFILLMSFAFSTFWATQNRALEINDWIGITSVVILTYATIRIVILYKNDQSHLPVEFNISVALVSKIYSDLGNEIREDSKGGKYSVPVYKDKIQVQFEDGLRNTYSLPKHLKSKIKEGDAGLVYISEFGKLVEMKYLAINQDNQQILV